MKEQTIRKIAIIIFVVAVIATLASTYMEWKPYSEELEYIEEDIEWHKYRYCGDGRCSYCMEYDEEIEVISNQRVLLWMNAVQKIATYAIGCVLLAGVATIINKLEGSKTEPINSPVTAKEAKVPAKITSEKQSSVAGNMWTCECGRVNNDYCTSCACGKNRRDLQN